jgi:NAD(P)H dehydrogenase (quinone)
MKNILVIKAHPRENSFSSALADNYVKGAKINNNIKILNLNELGLEKFVKYTHDKEYNLPNDLLNAKELISWSDHLVFIYPTWWASPPSLLKVFFEIVFHSGFAFKYKKSVGVAPKWDKLLLGKSARIISTMDSPPWYYIWIVGDPGYKMMKDILNFCGITPVNKNYFGSLKMSSKEQREKWLEEIYKVGLNEK